MADMKKIAKEALELMDLTTLNDNDTNETVEALCKQAKTKYGNTAAICIYPQFIPHARKVLNEMGLNDMPIATVTNFPHGNDDIAVAVEETRKAVELGADEVDVVFPYKALMAGNEEVGFDLVKQCKEACGDIKLKVIIESGVLSTEQLIKKASTISIKAGADFIKTSTGKVAINATPIAAEIMLQAIADNNPNCGFKAAGGVKNAEQAEIYLNSAREILGKDWVNSDHFRFGASSLLTSLIGTLSDTDADVDPSAY